MLVRSIVTPRGVGQTPLSSRSTLDPSLADLMSPRKPQKKKWDGLVTSNDISHVCVCSAAFGVGVCVCGSGWHRA